MIAANPGEIDEELGEEVVSRKTRTLHPNEMWPEVCCGVQSCKCRRKFGLLHLPTFCL